MPAIARIRVDLPAPLAPMMPTEVPSADVEGDVLDGLDLAHGALTAAEPDQRLLQRRLALESCPVGDGQILAPSPPGTRRH